MFTGIIESQSRVSSIQSERNNLEIGFECPFVEELKVDQSVAHNGICLTVTRIDKGNYYVTAISETLARTNLSYLKVGEYVNVERCLAVGGRLDGHIVQGHVDATAFCDSVQEVGGSWVFRFSYEGGPGRLTVEKGSVCVNGVSLTVVESGKDYFTVAIIPYTYNNTNFNNLKPGSVVNIEFDVLGKYVEKLLMNR